eukprot:UN06041
MEEMKNLSFLMSHYWWYDPIFAFHVLLHSMSEEELSNGLRRDHLDGRNDRQSHQLQ